MILFQSVRYKSLYLRNFINVLSKVMNENIKDEFPLSVTKEFKGTRRLAREKTLQILYAHQMSDLSIDDLYKHIVNRNFNFGDDLVEIENKKLLKPSEVLELEADIPINWEEEEIIYIQKLIKDSLQNKEYVESLIRNHAKHWEFDRIALIDRLIMLMAVTELMTCEDIPAKVTINEAIEIAKRFSTDKSNTFINGLLDRLSKELRKEGKIIKKGKGLINH